jgi:hypothetical protein
LGQLVRTLVSRRLEATNHDVIWDGADYAGRPQPSGVYFARLSADGDESVIKMTLLE